MCNVPYKCVGPLMSFGNGGPSNGLRGGVLGTIGPPLGHATGDDLKCHMTLEYYHYLAVASPSDYGV